MEQIKNTAEKPICEKCIIEENKGLIDLNKYRTTKLIKQLTILIETLNFNKETNTFTPKQNINNFEFNSIPAFKIETIKHNAICPFKKNLGTKNNI